MLSSDEKEIEMRDLDDDEESQQAEGLSINEQVDTVPEAVELEKDTVVKE
jgi:DNA-directed RNA polymerase subunit beta